MAAETKTTFALFFGTRGFFPGSLVEGARRELTGVLERHGYGCIMMDESLTRYGAVESRRDGELYASFLKEHSGECDGVILCLPNFGDETGAVAALHEAGVPILIQAYPDELDKMSPEHRHDAFCGKFSVMDVFHQYGVQFTALAPHTAAPSSDAFIANLDHFARVCRVVKAMKNTIVGAVGARTTAFKTVRIDELALQRHGITMETFDLSDIFARMDALDAAADAYKSKADVLKGYSAWDGVPDQAVDKLVRLGVVLDALSEECDLDALAVRCWVEMQTVLGISPCVLLSEMNNRRIPVACEVDVGNAVAMLALGAASGEVAACLDWNNNYADDLNKCILFHCGPVPQAMMAAKGCITDHAIIANAIGKGKGYGCNQGRIAPADITFSSMVTEAGALKFYVGQGRITDDVIAADYFGCAGVAEIPQLQDVLLHIGREGHRHHVSVTPGHVAAPTVEALRHYLGWDVTTPQNGV